MIISIHQPHYFPWLRYFNKIANSDLFVIYDDVKYEKNDWVHRTLVRSGEKIRLTIPVHSNTKSLICSVRTANDIWKTKHIKSIYHSYHKSQYFSNHFPQIERIIENSDEFMVDTNISSIQWAIATLGLKTTVIRSSELKSKSSGTSRIIQICQELGATTYLSGYHAMQTYLDVNMFKKNHIKLLYQDYMCEPYQQIKYNNYIPDLSIIDLLMNQANEQAKALISGGKIVEV